MGRSRSRGFTLMEMLVVFGVFALIGVISSQIVSRVIDNQQLMKERGSRLTEVQRAMHIIQRDVLQLAARPVRDQLGDPLPPMVIDAEGLIEFTRLGWRNPLGQARSELQRVAYVLRDGDLYRVYWRVLDRTPDTEPVLQRLLGDVERLAFSAVDVNGDEHSFWPVEPSQAEDPGQRLAAIVMHIETAPFGAVERLWAVPSV